MDEPRLYTLDDDLKDIPLGAPVLLRRREPGNLYGLKQLFTVEGTLVVRIGDGTLVEISPDGSGGWVTEPYNPGELPIAAANQPSDINRLRDLANPPADDHDTADQQQDGDIIELPHPSDTGHDDAERLVRVARGET